MKKPTNQSLIATLISVLVAVCAVSPYQNRSCSMLGTELCKCFVDS